LDAEIFLRAGETLSPVQAELLQRLLNDSRMENVWRQLRRQPRRIGQPPLYPKDAPELLIQEVLKITKERAYVIPRRDADEARKHYLEIAAVLKRDAKRFAPFPQMYSRTNADCLADAARFYDDLVASLTEESPVVVARNTGDPEARFFALALSTFCRDNGLGKAPYGIVATVATVIYDREITRDAVREWCRAGDKKLKKGGLSPH
jgi:plasmid stabilization system protein ParE